MDRSRYLKFLVKKNLATLSSVKNLPKICLPKSSRSYVTLSPILAQSQEGRLNVDENSDPAVQNDQNLGYRPRSQRSDFPNNRFSRIFESSTVPVGQDDPKLPAHGHYRNYGYKLEQKMFLINNDIRRYGRIDPKIFYEFLALLNPDDKISSPVALTLLKCCGSHLPMYTPEKRVELMHHFWDVLTEHNFKFDISHYNSLLMLYLENEHQFSPVEILAKLEKEDIEPNRVTFQRLIKRYAQMGDMDGVSAILEHMKSLDLPITEQVCTSLLFGNIKIKNENEVKQVLEFMKTNGIEPSPDCYLEMMWAYAENGDFKNVERILMEQSDITLSDKDLLKILYILVKNGHSTYTKEILDRLRKNTGYIHDALDWAMKLNAIGHPEEAVQILTTVHRSENSDFGGALLQQCIELNTNSENLLKMCDLMKKSGVHQNALENSYVLAAENKKKDLATILMAKLLEGREAQLRQQCFWPLILMNSQEKNLEGLNKVFTSMRDFDLFADVRTLADWMWPHLDGHVTLETLRQTAPTLNLGKLVTSYLVHALFIKDKNMIENIVEKYGNDIMRDPGLTEASERYMHMTGDVQTVVDIVKCIANYVPLKRITSVDYMVFHYLTGTPSETRMENTKEFLSQLLDQKIALNPDMLTRLIDYERFSSHPEIVDLLKQSLKLSQSIIESKQSDEADDYSEVQILDLLTCGDENELRKGISSASESKLNRAIHELCRANETQKILKILEIIEEFKIPLKPASYVRSMSTFLRNFDVENSFKLYNLAMKKKRGYTFFINIHVIMDLITLLADKRMYDELQLVLSDQLEIKMKQQEASRVREINEEKSTNNNVIYTNKAINTILTNFIQKIFTDKELAPEKALKMFGQFCDWKQFDLNGLHTNQIMDLLINKGDLTTAIGIFEKMTTCMKKSTGSVKLIQALAEKNDVTNLQKVYDLLTSVIGENRATLKLAVSLASINKMKEALRIVNTPAVYLPPEMIFQESKRLAAAENVKGMESLLHITKHKSPQIRDTLYQNLLFLYKKLGDYKSALNCWTLIQEENYTPSNEILMLIESILKEHNQPVPFSLKSDETPKKSFETTDSKKKSATADLMQRLANKKGQNTKHEAQKSAN